MPRRTRSNAEDISRAIRRARWRYVLRDPDFQRDVNLIREGVLSRTYAGQREAERITKRWSERGIYVPHYSSTSSWQRVPALKPATIPTYEALFDSEDSWGIGEAFSASDPWEDDDFSYERSYAGSPGRLRRIYVNLDYPLDVLIALIEQDLRDAIAGRTSKRRRRPEKIDFYLAVYDQAVLGKSFRDIATALGKPVSTLKTAYLVACGQVYAMRSPRPSSALEASPTTAGPEFIRPESVRAAPSKSQLPIVSLDPDTHMKTCRTCLRANRLEELCSQARAYVNQDLRVKSKPRESFRSQTRPEPFTTARLSNSI